MSIIMNMVKQQMKAQNVAMEKGFDVQALREGAKASMAIAARPDVVIMESTYAEIPADVLMPTNHRTDAIIIYIHGGGMVSGSAKYLRHFTAELAAVSGMMVIAIDYRLAPEFPFPIPVQDCFGTYQAIQKAYPLAKLALFGESAGATLSIVTALQACDARIELPVAVVAHSPLGAATGFFHREEGGAGELILKPGALETIANLYCPQDRKNPYASPAYADYHGFPPLRVVWDDAEVLAVDSAFIADKAINAGVLVERKAWTGTFHGFIQLAGIIPEANQELEDSVRFIQDQLSK